MAKRKYAGKKNNPKEVRIVATRVDEEDTISGEAAKNIEFYRNNVPYVVRVEGHKRVCGDNGNYAWLLRDYMFRVLKKTTDVPEIGQSPKRIEVRVLFSEEE